MTENKHEIAPVETKIANEPAFVAALGINPNVVQRGTISITFSDGTPVVAMAIAVPVEWATLAEAIKAGAPAETEEPKPVKEPTDRKPSARKRAAAKKAPAKRPS